MSKSRAGKTAKPSVVTMTATKIAKVCGSALPASPAAKQSVLLQDHPLWQDLLKEIQRNRHLDQTGQNTQ